MTSDAFAGELVARLLFYSSCLRSPQRMSFKPKHPGGRQRIYSGTLPPRCFVPAAMGPQLREAQVVRIRWPPTANEARLLHDVSDMIAVSNATRFGECEDALFNLDYLLGQALLTVAADGVARFWALGRYLRQFSCKRFFHVLRVGCN
jgi:hypothetical protein